MIRLLRDPRAALGALAAFLLAAPLTAEPPIDLADIAAGNGGFVMRGTSSGHEAGKSVSGAGDVNGDGLPDLIVGAESYATYDRGESYVVFGKADGAPVDLSAVEAGIGGFVIRGIDDDDRAAWVSGAGDVNGDGLQDVIIGAGQADPGGRDRAGESYVVFGKANGTPVALASIASGIGGFIINGIDPRDYSGLNSISGAGDVNDDGLDDVIVGAAGASPGGRHRAGESYVVFGKATTTPVDLSAIAAGAGGFVINGAQADDASGSVSGARDINGDGLDDLIVGASGATRGGNPAAGESYVVFGKADGTPVELSAVAGGAGGFAIVGWVASETSGFSVSDAGDVNGDGIFDLVVSAPTISVPDDAGQSYVVFGKLDTTPVDLGDVAGGAGGFIINGAQDFLGRCGYSVSGAGDFNGDGFDDLVIGDPAIDTVTGAGYLIFGKPDGDPIELSAVTAGGPGGIALTGINVYDNAGASVSGAGDVNGDGFDDIIVGAFGADGFTGESYVVFGFGAEPCEGDISGDGTVSIGDLIAILSAWGNMGGPEDLDGSGTVDIGDLLLVLTGWGPCE